AGSAMSKASATLSLEAVGLNKGCIINVVTHDTGSPNAILKTHPSGPNQHAMMAILAPKFSLLPENPEIVFVCDRNGSMGVNRIKFVKSAL
ncbi:hypothetical protein BGZ49_002042, partial [Haplosporangium sp. Z 27]